MTKDEAYEVSDSTDWLQTPLPSLAPVDSALRCQVCRDYYNTPMITSCSHTFCSLCIRHCLGNDGKCPACRKMDDASKLRNNHTVEDLVEAFKRARPAIMEYTKAKEAVRSVSPKRKCVEEVEGESSSPIRKRTRSGRTTRQSSQQVVVLDSEGEDEDFIPKETKKDGVQCPICNDYFPSAPAVQAHVDLCDGQPPSKKQKSRSSQTSIQPQQVSKPTKRPDRLPQLHYGTVKDNVLRKKLQDLGLSSNGSRQLMEKRYTEWITLWNANCDARNPKAKADLKREMDVWERTQGGGAQFASRGNSKTNIRDKDFDGSAYSTKYDDSFRQLIEEAKRKRAIKAKEPEGNQGHTKPESSSGVQMTKSMNQPAPYSSPFPTQPSKGLDTTMMDISSSTNESQNQPRSERIAALPPNGSSHGNLFEESNVRPVFNPTPSQETAMNSDMSTFRALRP